MHPDLAKVVFARDGYRCQGCGTTRDLELHHRVYRSQGGKDVPENLVTLCRRCHRRSHRYGEWRRKWEPQRSAGREE